MPMCFFALIFGKYSIFLKNGLNLFPDKAYILFSLKRWMMGWGCGLVSELLPCMHKALGLIPNTTHKKKDKIYLELFFKLNFKNEKA